MKYSISQFQAILSGLGYDVGLELGDPPDGNSLNDGLEESLNEGLNPYSQTIMQAIQAFQVDYQLPITGQLDQATTEKARHLMCNLHHSLNLVANAQIPVGEFYSLQTIAAVKALQAKFGFPVTGKADPGIRRCLSEEVKQQLRQRLCLSVGFRMDGGEDVLQCS